MNTSTKHTLLLRMAGPMQSWGTSSRWTERDTGLEPSKSGVVGVLAASLGRSRDADITDLAMLKMGVRVDQEGIPSYDYQTAGAGNDDPGIALAQDTPDKIERRRKQLEQGILKDSSRGKVSVSKRHYLMDAVFLVGLEGDDLDFLSHLDSALRRPVFPIGLGRRSYVPSVPIAMPDYGVREDLNLMDALEQETLLTDLLSRRSYNLERRNASDNMLTRRFIIELQEGNADTTRNDQPIGAAFATRQFGPRPIKIWMRNIHLTTKEDTDAHS